MVTFLFDNVFVSSFATVAGPKEKAGPYGKLFDKTYDSLYAGKKTLEEGEKLMQEESVKLAWDKAKLKKKSPDIFIAGDLNNQIACSSKVANNLNSSFIGIYGACSTSMLGVAIAASLIESEYICDALVSATSSFGTAERQFRYPLEYGLMKKETTTLTVTGSGSLVLSNKQNKIRVSEATLGQVYDVGWTDVNNIGASMSYAAAMVIKEHLNNVGHNSNYYDLILTGDLSLVGSNIMLEVLQEEGIKLSNYNDTGKMIYSKEDQKTFCGGSGVACCPLVTYTEIFKKLIMGYYKRVLVVATGALFDPVYVQQKKTIPSIAHAVTFERN